MALLKDLTSPFYNCPDFIQKPKLFFIDACRDDANSVEGQIQSDLFDATSNSCIYQRCEDYFLYSSTVGYSAWSEETLGTKFMIHLTNAMDEFGEKGTLN